MDITAMFKKYCVDLLQAKIIRELIHELQQTIQRVKFILAVFDISDTF